MRSIVRSIIPVLALATATAVATTTGAAQQPARQWIPEVRPFVGTSIPTGQLRDVIGSETQFGAQLASEMRPWLHVLGTFSWAPAHTRYVVGDRNMDVLQYDAGVEVNGSQPFTDRLQFHPFWGAGLGARTYLYDANELKDRTCASGYLSTGFQVQAGRTAARLEARDNVFCYRSPVPRVKAKTRNDLAFSAGLVYHFR